MLTSIAKPETVKLSKKKEEVTVDNLLLSLQNHEILKLHAVQQRQTSKFPLARNVDNLQSLQLVKKAVAAKSKLLH